MLKFGVAVPTPQFIQTSTCRYPNPPGPEIGKVSGTVSLKHQGPIAEIIGLNPTDAEAFVLCIFRSFFVLAATTTTTSTMVITE